MVKYSKIYPKAIAVLDDQASLFAISEYPEGIRRSIHTANLIENLNKYLKLWIKRNEHFPNEDSLERYAPPIANITNESNNTFIRILKNVGQNWELCSCNSSIETLKRSVYMNFLTQS